MKLELKHLTPYLPYELTYKAKGTVMVMKSIDTSVKMIDFGHGDAKELNEFKPILRPLSDLTKEIEINCNEFTPIVELLKIEEFSDELDTFEFIDGDKYCILDFCNEFGDVRFYCDWEDKLTFQKGTRNPNNHKPIRDFQSLYTKLLEWHFDVFGLIEKGLAIDINTLK